MKPILTYDEFLAESVNGEETITERYNKKSLLKKLGSADDARIQTGNGKEYIIYNPNNNNDDNTDMWGDKTIFALDQDGGEHEIAYKDIGLVMVESTVNEKTSFSQMKKDIKTKEYKEVSQAIDNAEEVSDIWNMLDPKMFKFTESEFEDIFDEWWNNITRYDSISDFSRNAFMEDVHSLYLHLLPYSEST